MNTHLSKYLSLLCLPFILVLASCGFHLRNALTIPNDLQKIYIAAPATNTNNSFVQSFLPMAAINHLQVVKSLEQANAIIKIININQTGPELTSMTGSGQAGQYTLNYEITFSIVDAKGKILLPATTMQQSRSFNSNASQILSANSQATQLTLDMQQTLAASILSQLASVHSTNS